MAILRSVTPLVEPISLDEAFLDVGGAAPAARVGDPRSRSRSARRIRAETGLTASVGVATHQAARQARQRPRQARRDARRRARHRARLPAPARRSRGCGASGRRPASGSRSSACARSGDLAALPEETLVHELGHAHGRHLHALAWNRDERAVDPDRAREVDRPRGDVPDRPHRPRRARARGAAHGRRGRDRLRDAGEGRPDRPAQAPLPRLPHDHPVAHAARADRSRGRHRRRRAAHCSTPSTSATGIRLLGVSVQQLRRRGRGAGTRRRAPRPVARSTSTVARLERRRPAASRRSRTRCDARAARASATTPSAPAGAARAGAATRARPDAPATERALIRDRARRLRPHRHGPLVRAAPARRRRPRRRAVSPRPTTPTTARGRIAGRSRRAPRTSSSTTLLDEVDVVWICTWTAAHLPRRSCRGGARSRASSARSRWRRPWRSAERIAGVLGQVPHQVGLVLRHAPVFRAVGRRRRDGPVRRGRWRSVLRDDQYFPIQGMYGVDLAQRRRQGRRRHADRALDPRRRRAALGARPASGEPHGSRRARRRCSGTPASTTPPPSRSGTGTGRPRRSSASGTRSSPGRRPRRLEVFCEEALLWTDDDYLGPLHVETADGSKSSSSRRRRPGSTGSTVPEVLAKPLAQYAEPSKAFLDALARDGAGARGHPDVGIALAAHRLVDRAYRSAAAGGRPDRCDPRPDHGTQAR